MSLRWTVEYLHPEVVFGVGRFAQERARKALHGLGISVVWMHHPSPANPEANKNWPDIVNRQLKAAGITFT
jgi:single-strand selective monofunctional uracil DNA glycosylase